ncbi:hypothetical protein ABZ611_21055 [Streptomyces sp. NPDC007861]|uniref:hypothetical protein n=1 Tax=Streptomyces sp. NPDC007861 TaxID=3154893 RepID=UPI0033CB29C4
MVATGGAVTLSWWGVQTVTAGTAYDRPPALPITADAHTAQDSAPQSSSPKHSGSVSPSASSVSSDGKADKDGREPSVSPVAEAPGGGPVKSSPAPAPSATVKSYTVAGGRATFDIGPTSAELLSATPESGWSVKTWHEPTKIQVTFAKDGRESDVIVVWHDTAPRVSTDER